MRELNEIMEFDHVIHVSEDGTISDAPGIYAPEVYVNLDSDGQMIGSDDRDGVDVLAVPATGWHFMHGYTGQYGSSSRSFIMHDAEYIAGGMARDILSTPGYYVAVVVDGLTEDDGDDDTIVGWAVAYRSES